ncbi:MAG TPA: SAM-dependent methyltransferase [Herpetosiphonaceae bacterium]
MELDPEWMADQSTETPSGARMYDYYLGGHHNFEVDRRGAERVAAVYPEVFVSSQANRALLRRMVGFLARQGVDQFLDIGSGIPAFGNVHEVAMAVNPEARTVYVDIDGVAVAHGQAVLKAVPQATMIQADVRQIEAIFEHPEVRRLLDFTRPVAVLLLALLHFVPDEREVDHILNTIRTTVPSGSYLVITNGTNEGAPPDLTAQIERLYSQFAQPVKFRSAEEIRRLFDGLDLVEPGIVYGPLWRPEASSDLFLDEPSRSLVIGGIGRKP